MELDVMYQDLTEAKQKKIKEHFGVETDEELFAVTNFDVFPVASGWVELIDVNNDDKYRCPHCGTGINHGHFNEKVAYAVPVFEEDGEIVRGSAEEPLDENFGEETYFCESCQKEFKQFEEGNK